MIKTIEVKNFKAIEKGKVKLTPLTAFIGYNGVGKSSMLEALEMFRAIITEGLDAAVKPWREFEHIYYKGKKSRRKFMKDGIELQFAPMEFSFAIEKTEGFALGKSFFTCSVGQELSSKGNLFYIQEYYKDSQYEVFRDADNNRIFDFYSRETEAKKRKFKSYDLSVLSDVPNLRRFVESWQFLSMNTFLMGEPNAQKKTSGAIQLQKDGRNIAEYILSTRDKDSNVLQGILETLQSVLPYLNPGS